MDGAPNCVLVSSKRGTYDRKAARIQQRGSSASSNQSPRQPSEQSTAALASSREECDAAVVFSADENVPCFPNVDSSTTEMSNRRASYVERAGPADSHGSMPSPATVRPSSCAGSSKSLSSMFEDHVGRKSPDTVGQCELVLFGEPSPLTFALQLRKGQGQVLHDTSQHNLNSSSLAVIQDDIHPPHLEPCDIEYLKAKGAFSYPPREAFDSMVDVFLNRFYLLYAVVDPTDLRRAHRARKLPWILLHAICFVAMTFCDASLIFIAGFKSRSEARHHYYSKAKALFDISYEKNKAVLLKVCILLSFEGPRLNCYWNPCSWIEIGVTMAVSLGLHRAEVAASGPPNDRSLLKRLWWALAVRDAHCSTLLGRPFRINITQCDTDVLALEDFPHNHEPLDPCTCKAAFMYQIQSCKLSLILRSIIHFRFGPVSDSITLDHIQQQLAVWKSEVPVEVSWSTSMNSNVIQSTQLETLYNYLLILLHMNPAGQFQASQRRPSVCDTSSNQIAESSALTISSLSVKLMTKATLSLLPHEIFSGFFVAGVILCRQTQQSETDNFAIMSRACFDNCQMVLNEAQDFWDPGKWAMRLFDFLLSFGDSNGGQAHDAGADISQREDGTSASIPDSSSYADPSWVEIPPVSTAAESNDNPMHPVGGPMLFPDFFNSWVLPYASDMSL